MTQPLSGELIPLCSTNKSTVTGALKRYASDIGLISRFILAATCPQIYSAASTTMSLQPEKPPVLPLPPAIISLIASYSSIVHQPFHHDYYASYGLPEIPLMKFTEFLDLSYDDYVAITYDALNCQIKSRYDKLTTNEKLTTRDTQITFEELNTYFSIHDSVFSKKIVLPNLFQIDQNYLGFFSDVPPIPVCENITRLDLSSSKVNDKDLFRIIVKCPNLEHLDLGNCSLITDTCLKYLPTLLKLKSLHLDNCKITVAGLEHVAKLKSLTSLRLSADFMSNRALLKSVENLSSLTSLTLNDRVGWGGVELEPLAKFENLTSLTISGSFFRTEADWQRVARLSNLTSLTIDGNLTEADWQHVATLSNLTSLTFNDCLLMEDRHLAYVAKLENLTSLFLVGSPRITNVGLRHVENMDKLWDLIVVGCRGIKNAEQVISMPRLVAKVREGLAALESQGVRFGRSTGS